MTLKVLSEEGRALSGKQLNPEQSLILRFVKLVSLQRSVRNILIGLEHELIRRSLSEIGNNPQPESSTASFRQLQI